MLHLTRKIGETIVVDGPARIVILESSIQPDKVLIGIDAPATTKILRGELAQADGARPPGR